MNRPVLPGTQQRGAALILSSLCLVLVTGYSLGSMVRSLTEQRTTQRFQRLSWAFQAAEAGLDRAITEVKTNSNWTGIGYTATLQGGFDVTVTPLDSTKRLVTVSGYYPSNSTSAYGYQRRQVEAVISVSSSDFDSVFVATTIDLDSNSRVDSYDSRLGLYGGTNIGTSGDLGSNSTGASTIHLDSNAYLGGDAMIGPGGNVNTAITLDRNATMTGTRQTLTSTKTLASKTYPGSGGTSALTLASNQSQRLSGGTYNYTHVDIDSGATVTFTGSATLYVDKYFKLDSNSQFKTDADCPTCTLTIYVNGNTYEGAPAEAFDIDSGSLLSANAKPTQLTVIVTGTGSSARSVQLDSNNGFYGAIHAPLSHVDLDSNVNAYGAILARSLQLDSGSKIHYDVALASSGGTSGSVQLLSWREL